MGIAFSPLPARPETVGYGHLVRSGPLRTVWWAEGAYKVMKDDPVPAAKGGVIKLTAARNEYEPFLLVLRPEARLGDVRVVAGPLTDENGGMIDAANISVCHVGYVNVTTPTDALGKAKNKAIVVEAAKLLDFPAKLFTSGTEYTKDPLDLLRYRAKVAEMIEKLTAR